MENLLTGVVVVKGVVVIEGVVEGVVVVEEVVVFVVEETDITSDKVFTQNSATFRTKVVL
jgi:hypothetical protein